MWTDNSEKYLMRICRYLLQLLIYSVTIFLLAGCLPGALKISINDSRTGVAEFIVDRESGNCGEGDGALIQSIWFGRVQDDGKAKTIWSLRSIDAQGHSIHSLEYGVVPIGFNELEKTQLLVSGGHYDAEISGHGCSGGLRFTIK